MKPSHLNHLLITIIWSPRSGGRKKGNRKEHQGKFLRGRDQISSLNLQTKETLFLRRRKFYSRNIRTANVSLEESASSGTFLHPLRFLYTGPKLDPVLVLLRRLRSAQPFQCSSTPPRPPRAQTSAAAARPGDQRRVH